MLREARASERNHKGLNLAFDGTLSLPNRSQEMAVMPQVPVAVPALADAARIFTKESLASIIGGFILHIIGRYVGWARSSAVDDLFMQSRYTAAYPMERSSRADTVFASTSALTRSNTPFYQRVLANTGTCNSALAKPAPSLRRASTVMSSSGPASFTSTMASTTCCA